MEFNGMVNGVAVVFLYYRIRTSPGQCMYESGNCLCHTERGLERFRGQPNVLWLP